MGIAAFSMLVGIVMAAVKIIVGLAANSTAVVSDGFESASDVLTSGIVLGGLYLASKPPDKEHPYGHGRFETLAGLAVGTILAVSGILICVRALYRLNDPAHIPAAFAMWPVIASLFIKGGIFGYKLRAGRRTGSAALVADAWHDAVDMLSGVTALAALGIALANPAYSAADHYGGFLVGIFVVFLGARVVRETTEHLLDTMPDPERIERIRSVAMGVDGALAIEKLYARKTGLRYHVDLHLEVDPELTVRESHEIARNVKRAVRGKLDWVADVLVHVEPHLTQEMRP
ncbi:MAG: cation diffusion facilitator family transporter [Bryobacteraceae bacterium]